MRVRILPYRAGSGSARVLSEALGVPRLRVVRTTFRPRPSDVIINWGNGEPPFDEERECVWYNHPNAVRFAQNKHSTLALLREHNVPHPDFTVHQPAAQDWLDNGVPVVARRLLRASQARGLVLVQPGEELPAAPLYTRYVKKADEYRIHIGLMGGNYNVIDIQQKRRRSGAESDSQIRNAANGWVYCREGVAAPAEAVEAACAAVRALGLDFGAVDLGWNRHHSRPCVYEVNTAPGLEGSTTRAYADYFAGRTRTG